MSQLVEEWMREMGIDPENTQYIIASHFDKEHPHCHLVFNRIANDGSVISDSKERLRNEGTCRNIKLRHRLTFGNTRSPKINQDRLRKYEAAKILIRNLVADSLIQSTDWKSFADNLEINGVKTHLSLDEKSGNIRGIAFEHDGFRIFGSKLCHHGAYTYWRIEDKFGQLRENPKIRELPELIRERKTIYIPIVRYVEFVTSVRTILSKETEPRLPIVNMKSGRNGKNGNGLMTILKKKMSPINLNCNNYAIQRIILRKDYFFPSV